MKCHLCDQAAVDRCYQCGQLFCEQHGKVSCSACTTGIAAGDPRQDRVSTKRMNAASRGFAWWRPVVAEAYVPPACHQCGSLARSQCVGCGRRYCPAHAGPGGRCAACHASNTTGTLFGFVVIVALGLIFAAALLWNWFVERGGGS
jgi:hypothetical protein